MIRKIISILFFILLIIPFIVLVLLLSLKLTILNPSFVKRELKKHDAYNVIHRNFPEISEQVLGEIEDREEAPPSKSKGIMSLDRKSIPKFAQKLISPKTMEAKTEAVLDSIMPWLFGGQELKPVPLNDFKKGIYEGIIDAFRQQYNSLPICKKRADFKYDLKTCRLKGKSFDELVREFQKKRTGNPDKPLFAIGIPDRLDINALAKGDSDVKNKYEGAKTVRETISPFFRFWYVYPFIFLVILILLSWLFARNWRKIPPVLGAYLIVLGLFSCAVNLIVMSKIPSLIPKDILQGFQKMPKIRSELIIPLARDIFADTKSVMITLPLFTVGVGMLMILSFWLYKKIISPKSRGI